MGESEPKEEGTRSAERRQRVTHAWRLLEAWHTLPGLEPPAGAPASEQPVQKSPLPASSVATGTVNTGLLNAWVRTARELARNSDRVDSCDKHIGMAFAYAPADADGSWPCSAVRDLIESIASPRLEAGFGMATLNKRGTHTVGPTGEAERKLRDDFRAFAERVLHKHPRTAALINRVAEHYDGEANDRDKDGRLAEFEDM